MGAYEFPVIPGDTDMNKELNLADAVSALKVCAGMETEADKAADADKSGNIGLGDALYILRYLAF